MSTQTMKWPDCSAHGFNIRIAKTNALSHAVIVLTHVLTREHEAALSALGFEVCKVPGFGSSTARPLSGLSLRALVQAFPQTVVRDQPNAEVFLIASQSPDVAAKSSEATPTPAVDALLMQDQQRLPEIVEGEKPGRFRSMFIERERYGSRPGYFTVNGSPHDGEAFIVGNFPEGQLAVVLGDEFAAQVIREAPTYPDGKTYPNPDIALYPTLHVRGERAFGAEDYGDRLPFNGVFESYREISDSARKFRRDWTVVEGANGATYALPGTHLTNVVGFFETEHPWVTGAEQYLFTSSHDADVAADDGATDSDATDAMTQQDSDDAPEVSDWTPPSPLGGVGPRTPSIVTAETFHPHERVVAIIDAKLVAGRVRDTANYPVVTDAINVVINPIGSERLDCLAVNRTLVRYERISKIEADLDAAFDREFRAVDSAERSRLSGSRFDLLLDRARRSLQDMRNVVGLTTGYDGVNTTFPQTRQLLLDHARTHACMLSQNEPDEEAMTEAMLRGVFAREYYVNVHGMGDAFDTVRFTVATMRELVAMFDPTSSQNTGVEFAKTRVALACYDGAISRLPEGAEVYAPGAYTDDVWTVTLLSSVAGRSRFYGVTRAEAAGNAIAFLAINGVESPAQSADAQDSPSGRMASQLPVTTVPPDFDGDDAALQAEQEASVAVAQETVAQEQVASDGDTAVTGKRKRASRKKAATDGADSDSTGSDRKQSLDDFGEKIGGARKDLSAARSRGWMTVADMDAWTDYERSTLLRKDSVWPAPDYRQMVTDGVPKPVAWIIKRIRDGILPQPRCDADAASYVEAVGTLAERLVGVRGIETLQTALAPYVLITHDTVENRWDGPQKRTRWSDTPAADALNRHWQKGRKHGWGCMIALVDVFSRDAHQGMDLTEATRELNRGVNKDWPFKKVQRATAKDTTERDHVRPHLAHLVRVGGPDRRKGADITEAVFMKTFGFRAGEFGNWLTNKDRQQVFNHAYDALSDLAQCMNLPTEAMSLGGTLAIAFGARGRGGKNAAAAHYEPGRKVMNLTKVHGDGSLAHEWMHALDHFLHEHLMAGAQSAIPKVERPYLSALAHSAASRGWGDREIALAHVTNEDERRALAVAGSALYKAMINRPMSRDEAIEIAAGKLKHAEVVMRSWENYLRAIYVRVMRVPETERGADSTNADLARFNAQVAAFYGASHCHGMSKAGSALCDMVMQAIRGSALNNVASEVLSREKKNLKSAAQMFGSWGPGNLESLRDTIERIKRTSDEVFAQPKHASGMTSTQYLADAKSRDQGRSSPYYSLAWELFARAGESMVFDRLAESGIQSDYLVHGVGDAAMRSEQYGSPYPSGDDRAAIRAAFDRLLVALPWRAMLPATGQSPEAEPARKHAGMGM